MYQLHLGPCRSQIQTWVSFPVCKAIYTPTGGQSLLLWRRRDPNPMFENLNTLLTAHSLRIAERKPSPSIALHRTYRPPSFLGDNNTMVQITTSYTPLSLSPLILLTAKPLTALPSAERLSWLRVLIEGGFISSCTGSAHLISKTKAGKLCLDIYPLFGVHNSTKLTRKFLLVCQRCRVTTL